MHRYEIVWRFPDTCWRSGRPRTDQFWLKLVLKCETTVTYGSVTSSAKTSGSSFSLDFLNLTLTFRSAIGAQKFTKMGISIKIVIFVKFWDRKHHFYWYPLKTRNRNIKISKNFWLIFILLEHPKITVLTPVFCA